MLSRKLSVLSESVDNFTWQIP